MKAEKGSEIITTICEYENSVAMPDNERLTYLDTCGIARLKDGNGNVKAQEAYANRCSEYLRFGHEVDLAACGAYSPYDALKVCDTPEIFLKTGFEQRPMLYTQKHLFQALTPKSDYNPHRHGFSIEQVKRFPELLASPVVLANSPTRNDVLLAILLATDAYDTPLIAGIKPDGTGNYGEREVETNMVLSVYSRQNFIRCRFPHSAPSLLLVGCTLCYRAYQVPDSRTPTCIPRPCVYHLALPTLSSCG